MVPGDSNVSFSVEGWPPHFSFRLQDCWNTQSQPQFFLGQLLQPHCSGRDPEPGLSPAHWGGWKEESSEGWTWPDGLRALSGLGPSSIATFWPVTSAFLSAASLMTPVSEGRWRNSQRHQRHHVESDFFLNCKSLHKRYVMAETRTAEPPHILDMAF